MLKLVSLVCFAIIYVTSQETESNEACSPQTINYNYYSKDVNPVGGPSIQQPVDVLQGRPGKMGSRGFKGDKGDQGEACNPDNPVVESLRSELANLTTRFVMAEEKNNEMATEYERKLIEINRNLTRLTTKLAEVEERNNETATEIQNQIDNLESSTGCPGVTFNLPRNNQNIDYVRYRAYVPYMKEVTVCAWIETVDYNSYSAYFSYATPQTDNELIGAFTSSTTIIINSERDFFLSHPAFRGQIKVHICLWYSSISGMAGLSLNGRSVTSRSATRSDIRGGGSLILGQEQDAHNAGRLDTNQAFSGSITNFMMWPRLLSSEEILVIATNCECPRDYSVAMTMDKSELHGEASYSVPRQCPTL